MVVIEISFHHISNPIQDMDIKDLIAKLSDLSVSETFVTPSVPLENTVSSNGSSAAPCR